MKTHTYILLITCVMAFASTLYILFHINADLVMALNIYKSDLELLHYLIVTAHSLILLLHLYVFYYLFLHFRYFKPLRLLRNSLLILSVISLFSMGVEKIMIDEIAREFRYGFGIDKHQLFFLNAGYILNLIFSLTMFLFLLKTIKLVESSSLEIQNIDELIFVIAQYLGIVAGVAGIVFTFHMLYFVRPDILQEKLWALIPFYVMFFVPYAVVALYWLSLKLQQHIANWYDEKQLQDIFKASFTTLILSIPGMVIFMLFEVPHSIFWIIYYIFLVMLLFSGSTLYYFKIKDIS